MDTRQAEIVDKIHFAVMAIEASAKEMRISPMEMRRRLEKVGLVRRLLLDCYDVMHTQSLRHVAEDVGGLAKLGSRRTRENERRRVMIVLYHGTTLRLE